MLHDLFAAIVRILTNLYQDLPIFLSGILGDTTYYLFAIVFGNLQETVVVKMILILKDAPIRHSILSDNYLGHVGAICRLRLVLKNERKTENKMVLISLNLKNMTFVV